MFLRESRQKRADGTIVSHYQLAESGWDRERGRSQTRIIYSFGRSGDPQVVERLRKLARSILRRCSPEEIVAEDPSWRVVDAWPHGDLYVLERLWQRLGLAAIITEQARRSKLGFAVERALFGMVANRALAPGSKLYCWERWLREEVWIRGTRKLSLQHLYRAMDFLEAHKEEIQEAIFFRVSDLLNLDVDLIFYDTTSLHFEIDEEDEGSGEPDTVPGRRVAGGRKYRAPRKRGYSKNGRGDAPQIVIGLAVTRDGLPVRHWVFAGNTVDVDTIQQVKADLRGWKLGRCVFVGDAGMVSRANLRTLSLGGGRYIVCMPVHRGGEVERDVVTRPGRFREVAENLRVKEVIVGAGERRRRYVVCHNPEEEARQRRHRAKVLKELEAELASLTGLDDPRTHTKRTCALRTSRRYGKYLTMLKSGRLRIDKAAVGSAEKHDGRFVVSSNDDTLTAEDLALGYKQLMRVEQAWRTLKSGIKIRPVYHWVAHRIQAHVAVSMLALLLERAAERECLDTWRNIRDDLKQIKLARLSGPNGELWQVTEPSNAARKRLKSLKIDNPPAVVDHA
ncbi:MAG: IS1634 family transposase [Acidobacteriota bacterium]